LLRRPVLVVAEEPAQLAAVADCLRPLGAQVDTLEGLDSLDPLVHSHRHVFFAFDGQAGSLSRLLGHLRDSAQVVCVVPPLALPAKLALLGDPRSNHLLRRGDQSLLAVTARKLLSGDIFGLEKYLPEGTDVRHVRLRDYRGRSLALELVAAAAERVGARRGVRAAIAQVCEELLMNALYDAPVDERGRPLFADVDTRSRLERQSPRPVSLRWAQAEDTFVVAVRDRFGRLDKQTILRYLEKCAASGQQIERKAGGAGLGLYLVANAATGLVVDIAPGMATEIICTFDLAGHNRLRALSLFVHPGSTARAQPAAE
jgi:hypothetical protein